MVTKKKKGSDKPAAALPCPECSEQKVERMCRGQRGLDAHRAFAHGVHAERFKKAITAFKQRALPYNAENNPQPGGGYRRFFEKEDDHGQG